MPTTIKILSHILLIKTSAIWTHHSRKLIIESTSVKYTWTWRTSLTYSLTMCKYGIVGFPVSC